MNDSIRTHDDRLKVSIPLEKGQKKRFQRFLKATGRKAGPYLRVLAMREVKSWEAIHAGQTQVEPAIIQEAK